VVTRCFHCIRCHGCIHGVLEFFYHHADTLKRVLQTRKVKLKKLKLGMLEMAEMICIMIIVLTGLGRPILIG